MIKKFIAIAIVALLAVPLASAATTAKAAADKKSAKAGEDIAFNAAGSTVDAGTRIISYQWNFGDGTTASGVRVTKNYTANGVFNVVLTVVDSKGAVVTDSLNVSILAPEASAPKITHTPITKATAGEAFDVKFSLDGTPRGAEVYYKVGEVFVNTTAKKGADGNWSATIPGSAVQTNLSYYVSAVGTDGRASRLPASAPDAFEVKVEPKPATPTPSPTPKPSPSPTPVATPTDKGTTPGATKEGTPGFGLVAGLVALAAVAVALRRRQ